MKKTKHFVPGDKVFAKVKGYPAWPARVDEELGKKFRVYFYGTGETGIVKVEDLFSYVEHKVQFIKTLKRKDYNDAIEEIEAAIKESGDSNVDIDANDKSMKVEKQPDESQPEEKSETKRGVKRKLSNDSASGENKTPNRKPSPVKNEKKDENPTDTDKQKSLTPPVEDDECNKNVAPVVNDKKDVKKKKTTDTEELETTEKVLTERETDSNSNAKFIVVQAIQLQRTIDECLKVIMDLDDKKEITNIPDNINLATNAVLLTQVEYGKYIGIKINRNEPAHFKNGVERLQFAVQNARNALKLKERVENNTLNPEDEPEHFEFNLQLTKDQLQHEIGLRIVKRKKYKLQWLKMESTLVELDAMIKTSLGLDKADPSKALNYLEQMMQLQIHPLMLKKHPHVVDMIKRLRRYIGNVKEWKLKDKELTDFQEKAEEIRKKAEVIYAQLKKLFKIREGSSFGEVFQEQVEQFKDQTKDMVESQVFALCAEPGSKQALWDELDDQEEIKLLSEKYGKRKEMEKENIDESKNEEENSNTTETADNHG